MKLIYTDPKKKNLQKIEIGLMVLLLPLGLYFGGKTVQQWQQFSAAEAIYREAANLCHASNYDEGIPKLQQALELYPLYYAAWEELGVSYHMLGQHDKEVETYRRAAELLPDNGNIRRELASAYHEIGEHDKELEQAELALNMANSDPLFTLRVVERSRKEANGEISEEVLERPHQHGDEQPLLEGQQSPGEHHGHTGHEGHDHSHEGHSH